MTGSANATGGALRGLRVLDLTRLLPGPYATQMLVHHGADVIKVEDTGEGDYARGLGPLKCSGFGAAFTASNRGKRSVAIDLKAPRGVAALKALVADADVLVESFRPGVMDRLGVGHAVLRAHNPRLIYCAITGFGQATRRAHLAGHDLNYQGLSGLLSRPAQPPVMPTTLIADLVGGSMSAMIAIQSALLERARTGEGRFIDLSITHSALMLQPLLATLHLAHEDAAPMRRRFSGEHPAYRLYETSDGRHLALAALEAKFWDRLCVKLDCADLCGAAHGMDEATARSISSRLEAIFRRRSRAEWALCGQEWDVCLTPVLDVGEAIDESENDGLPLFGTFAGLSGEIKVLSGSPADLARTETAVFDAPPRHGQHGPGAQFETN